MTSTPRQIAINWLQGTLQELQQAKASVQSVPDYPLRRERPSATAETALNLKGFPGGLTRLEQIIDDAISVTKSLLGQILTAELLEPSVTPEGRDNLVLPEPRIAGGDLNLLEHMREKHGLVEGVPARVGDHNFLHDNHPRLWDHVHG